jgi:hypothetical protein
MSKRLTIYLPDDVAERLGREENASAFLTEAARRVMSVEATRAGLAASGYPDLPQNLVDEQGRALDREASRRDDPMLIDQMRQRLAEFKRPAR